MDKGKEQGKKNQCPTCMGNFGGRGFKGHVVACARNRANLDRELEYHRKRNQSTHPDYYKPCFVLTYPSSTGVGRDLNPY